MPTHARLTDAAIRHQIYLERLKTQYVRQFLSKLTVTDRDIKRILKRWDVEKLNELTRPQLEATLRELTVAQGEAFARATDALLEELPKVAEYEAEFQARTINAVAKSKKQRIKIPKPSIIHKESLERPIQAFGKRVADVCADWGQAAIDRTNGAVRVAYEQGKTVSETVRELIGTESLQYKDGKGAISRRAATTVVRTSVQQVANTARAVTYEENDDLVEGYEWVSTLDGKTTTQCRSLDGQTYKVGEGPMPPIHPNCRSTTAPVLSKDFDFLDDGATRSSIDGYVKAETTYYEWLKGQSPAFQDEVLGEARGKLFRNGGLSIERFRELQLDKNFQPISLERMRKLEPAAFERAGLK
jgi:SPP1 gp7 family putative phage head morphogenesis protein